MAQDREQHGECAITDESHTEMDQTRPWYMPRLGVLGLVLLAMSQCCCFSGLAKFAQRQPSTMVLLRHGEREDYMAQKAGRGAQWVKDSPRPWDPALAPNGQLQARSAAKRLRQVLETAQLPLPSKIFTSPMLRAVETANFVADEFAIKSLYVEEGLTESVYEHWMRQWAVPGANSDWGGPPQSCMPQGRNCGDPRLVRGTPVAEEDLRPEALEGASKLIPTSRELKLKCGFSRVDESYVSCVPVRDRGYRWGHFETHAEVVQRCSEAVRKLMARHPQETLVFVSHGGPTQYCLKEFSGQKYEGSAGMTALSVLRAREASWEVVVANDAAHAKAHAVGEETKI